MHVAFKSVQPWLRLLDNGFCAVKAQRLCFYPKNEPPGCVVLQKEVSKGGKTDAYN